MSNQLILRWSCTLRPLLCLLFPDGALSGLGGIVGVVVWLKTYSNCKAFRRSNLRVFEVTKIGSRTKMIRLAGGVNSGRDEYRHWCSCREESEGQIQTLEGGPADPLAFLRGNPPLALIERTFFKHHNQRLRKRKDSRSVSTEMEAQRGTGMVRREIRINNWHDVPLTLEI